MRRYVVCLRHNCSVKLARFRACVGFVLMTYTVYFIELVTNFNQEKISSSSICQYLFETHFLREKRIKMDLIQYSRVHFSQKKCAPRRYRLILGKHDFFHNWSLRQALQSKRFRSSNQTWHKLENGPIGRSSRATQLLKSHLLISIWVKSLQFTIF